MSDEYERPEHDRATCPECNGSGSVRVILGDDEQQDRCPSCAGTGVELSRDELLDAMSQADGSGDLRLTPEPADQPSFANHAEEIEWHLAQAFRRAS